MPVTIKDVARKLNLSIYTVSRALNGYDDVAETTRQKVIEMAHEMGYSPSRAARNLRLKRADAIGYILPVGGGHFTDAFFGEFIAGLGDETTAHNFDLLVSTAQPDSPTEKEIYHRWVESHLVDGIILTRMRQQDWRAKYLFENDFPFIVNGHTLLETEYPYLEYDARTGFSNLVRHLVERGYSRIAYIGAPAMYSLQIDRFRGYQDGLAAAGISFDESLVTEGDFTFTGGYQAALQLLDLPQSPTAIMCVNDMTAIGTMRAAHERGFEVGRDLAITGYDGTEASEHTQPPLTTLKAPVYESARRLSAMLFALLAGEQIANLQLTNQTELIVRGSTGNYILRAKATMPNILKH
jgi:LacI family transcriptional regulator